MSNDHYITSEHMEMSSPKTYFWGYGLSLITTLASFGLVEWHIVSEHVFPEHTILFPVIVVLALVQCIVQAIFFLHLGRGLGQRARTIVFLLTAFIVFILVGGSLWIMNNLNRDHPMTTQQVFQSEAMTPQEMNMH